MTTTLPTVRYEVAWSTKDEANLRHHLLDAKTATNAIIRTKRYLREMGYPNNAIVIHEAYCV